MTVSPLRGRRSPITGGAGAPSRPTGRYTSSPPTCRRRWR